MFIVFYLFNFHCASPSIHERFGNPMLTNKNYDPKLLDRFSFAPYGEKESSKFDKLNDEANRARDNGEYRGFRKEMDNNN